MLDKLRNWYRIRRHVNALRRAHIVCIHEQDFNNHDYTVDALSRWADKSGSLHNGATPNHTKKRVRRFAEVLRAFFPVPLA